jgi:outer membrane protein OmpA-like peptidoglycan-associated protein
MNKLAEVYIVRSIQIFIFLSLLIGAGFSWGMDCELAAEYYHRAKSESDVESAISWLNQSIQVCPNFNSWYILGLMHARQNEIETASKAFAHARSLAVTARTEALALAHRGQMLVQSGQMLQALQAFELACRFHPTPVPVWLNASLKQTRIRAYQHIVPADSIARVLESGIQTSTDGRFTVRPAVNLPVHFEFDRSNLNSAATLQVYELGLAISGAQLRNRSFILVGHTDKRGTAAYNQRLSQARADTVQDELERKFPSLIGRLQSTGRGESELLYDGNSEIDHQLNRRVKVTVMD